MSREEVVRIIHKVEHGLENGLSPIDAIDYAAHEEGVSRKYIADVVGKPGRPGLCWEQHLLGVEWSCPRV